MTVSYPLDDTKPAHLSDVSEGPNVFPDPNKSSPSLHFAGNVATKAGQSHDLVYFSGLAVLLDPNSDTRTVAVATQRSLGVTGNLQRSHDLTVSDQTQINLQDVKSMTLFLLLQEEKSKSQMSSSRLMRRKQGLSKCQCLHRRPMKLRRIRSRHRSRPYMEVNSELCGCYSRKILRKSNSKVKATRESKINTLKTQAARDFTSDDEELLSGDADDDYTTETYSGLHVVDNGNGRQLLPKAEASCNTGHCGTCASERFARLEDGLIGGSFIKYAKEKSDTLLQELLRLPLVFMPDEIIAFPLLLPYSSPSPLPPQSLQPPHTPHSPYLPCLPPSQSTSSHASLQSTPQSPCTTPISPPVIRPSSYPYSHSTSSQPLAPHLTSVPQPPSPHSTSTSIPRIQSASSQYTAAARLTWAQGQQPPTPQSATSHSTSVWASGWHSTPSQFTASQKPWSAYRNSNNQAQQNLGQSGSHSGGGGGGGGSGDSSGDDSDMSLSDSEDKSDDDCRSYSDELPHRYRKTQGQIVASVLAAATSSAAAATASAEASAYSAKAATASAESAAWSAQAAASSALAASESAVASAASAAAVSMFSGDPFLGAATTFSSIVSLSPAATTSAKTTPKSNARHSRPPSSIFSHGRPSTNCTPISMTSATLATSNAAISTSISMAPALEFIDLAISAGIMDSNLFGACYIKATNELDMTKVEHEEEYRRLNMLADHYLEPVRTASLSTGYHNSGAGEIMQVFRQTETKGGNDDDEVGCDGSGSNCDDENNSDKSDGSLSPSSIQHIPHSILKRRNDGLGDDTQTSKQSRFGPVMFNETTDVQYYNPRDRPRNASVEQSIPVQEALLMRRGLVRRMKKRQQSTPRRREYRNKATIEDESHQDEADDQEEMRRLEFERFLWDSRSVQGEGILQSEGEEERSASDCEEGSENDSDNSNHNEDDDYRSKDENPENPRLTSLSDEDEALRSELLELDSFPAEHQPLVTDRRDSAQWPQSVQQKHFTESAESISFDINDIPDYEDDESSLKEEGQGIIAASPFMVDKGKGRCDNIFPSDSDQPQPQPPYSTLDRKFEDVNQIITKRQQEEADRQITLALSESFKSMDSAGSCSIDNGFGGSSFKGGIEIRNEDTTGSEHDNNPADHEARNVMPSMSFKSAERLRKRQRDQEVSGESNGSGDRGHDRRSSKKSRSYLSCGAHPNNVSYQSTVVSSSPFTPPRLTRTESVPNLNDLDTKISPAEDNSGQVDMQHDENQEGGITHVSIKSENIETRLPNAENGAESFASFVTLEPSLILDNGYFDNEESQPLPTTQVQDVPRVSHSTSRLSSEFDANPGNSNPDNFSALISSGTESIFPKSGLTLEPSECAAVAETIVDLETVSAMHNIEINASSYSGSSNLEIESSLGEDSAFFEPFQQLCSRDREPIIITSQALCFLPQDTSNITNDDDFALEGSSIGSNDGSNDSSLTIRRVKRKRPLDPEYTSAEGKGSWESSQLASPPAPTPTPSTPSASTSLLISGRSPSPTPMQRYLNIFSLPITSEPETRLLETVGLPTQGLAATPVVALRRSVRNRERLARIGQPHQHNQLQVSSEKDETAKSKRLRK
ncbi:hypothetical protein BGX27_009513 [Mortierella sp. AM989]|nr:hypothetical protein BGX27_009513 [Mortierella sp. AM989]